MLVAPFTFFRGSAAVMAGPSVAAAYGELCGWTLARHARSGDRIAIASYLGSGDAFDRGVIGARRDM